MAGKEPNPSDYRIPVEVVETTKANKRGAFKRLGRRIGAGIVASAAVFTAACGPSDPWGRDPSAPMTEIPTTPPATAPETPGPIETTTPEPTETETTEPSPEPIPTDSPEYRPDTANDLEAMINEMVHMSPEEAKELSFKERAEYLSAIYMLSPQASGTNVDGPGRGIKAFEMNGFGSPASQISTNNPNFKHFLDMTDQERSGAMFLATFAGAANYNRYDYYTMDPNPELAENVWHMMYGPAVSSGGEARNYVDHELRDLKRAMQQSEYRGYDDGGLWKKGAPIIESGTFVDPESGETYETVTVEHTVRLQFFESKEEATAHTIIALVPVAHGSTHSGFAPSSPIEKHAPGENGVPLDNGKQLFDTETNVPVTKIGENAGTQVVAPVIISIRIVP